MAYSLVEKDIELKYRGNSPSPLHNEKDSLVNGIDTRPNTPAAQSKMQRKLLGRHLTMIAIGGTIGTGLFLKSGSAIGRAGPVGALITFAVVGVQVFGVVTGLGEMATYLPIPGAFSQLSSRFVNNSFGFSCGWNYWLNWSLTLPAELVAIGIVIVEQWGGDVPAWVWSFIFLIPLLTINMVSVSGFGEAEYILSFIKVFTIVVFLIFSLFVFFGASDLGFIGFKNWNIIDFAPFGGASFSAKFVNLASAFTTAFYSFGGTEMVGITAGEAANARKSVPRAIKGTFYRIILFYLLSIFFIGAIIPANSPDITMSPFVYVFKIVGISLAADIMTVIVIVSATSAANSAIYACSRTLMGLSAEKKAPAFFNSVNSRGVPVYSMLASVGFGSMAVLSNFIGSGVAFNFLSGVIGSTTIFSWMAINITHLRFRRGYLFQQRDLKDLPYLAPYFPYADYVSLIIGFFVLASLFVEVIVDTYTHSVFNWVDNSWCYIGIPGFIVLYICYGYYDKFDLIPYGEMDFENGKINESNEDDGLGEEINSNPTNFKEWVYFIVQKLA